MKNISYIIALLGAFVFLACTDQLEEDPTSFVDPASFYRNAADAEAAIIAAYGPLNDVPYYINGIAGINNYASDEATTRVENGNQSDLDSYQNVNNETNGFLLSFWQQAYTLNTRANAVIERISNIEGMDENLKKEIVAEAKFLRALNYFNLVRLFGEVPLIREEVTTAQDLNVSKSPVSEIYDLIIADLTEAAATLPESYSGPNLGRATRGAAQGLLAKVYLTRENWAQAASSAQTVIASESYSLIPEYAVIFTAPDDNPEIVFAAQFAPQPGQSTRISFNYAPRGTSGVTSPTAWGDRQSELLFYTNYPDDDPRKEVTFMTEYVDNEGETVSFEEFDFPTPHIKKYISQNPLNDINFPILRYADILLMAAEAINQAEGPTEEAYRYINQVRERAGVAPLATGLSQKEFDEAVFAERRLELPYEGHAWFDLVRTQRLKEYVERSAEFNKTYEAQNPNERYTQPQNVTVQVPLNYVFPIPRRELLVNPALTQNEGF